VVGRVEVGLKGCDSHHSLPACSRLPYPYLPYPARHGKFCAWLRHGGHPYILFTQAARAPRVKVQHPSVC
jgi:hypothetical protein